MAFREELPWQITTRPRTPSRQAPPTSSGSSAARRLRSAGFSSIPPIFARVLVPAAPLMRLKNADAQPSRSFSATLPVKPSVTTTSAVFLSRSRPSTLPTKFKPEPASNSCAARASSLPLLSSSPMFSSPTLGDATPSTVRAYAEPSTPNSSRFSGRQSALAPESSSSTGPVSPGRVVTMAGRRMPVSLFTTSSETASMAPVFPADINP